MVAGSKRSPQVKRDFLSARSITIRNPLTSPILIMMPLSWWEQLLKYLDRCFIGAAIRALDDRYAGSWRIVNDMARCIPVCHVSLVLIRTRLGLLNRVQSTTALEHCTGIIIIQLSVILQLRPGHSRGHVRLTLRSLGLLRWHGWHLRQLCVLHSN